MAVGRANPLHPSDVVVFNANNCEMTKRLAIGTVPGAASVATCDGEGTGLTQPPNPRNSVPHRRVMQEEVTREAAQ